MCVCFGALFSSICNAYKFPLPKDMEACKRKLADLLTDFLFAVSVLIRWNVHIINIRIDFCADKTKLQHYALSANISFVIVFSFAWVSLIINYIAIGCVQVINLSYMATNNFSSSSSTLLLL